MTALDRDLLDAFLPEFEAEAARLATATDAASATRALDQLRAMVSALGAPSLLVLAERAAAALDPFDLPTLHEAAETLARQAKAINAAGRDVPSPSRLPEEAGERGERSAGSPAAVDGGDNLPAGVAPPPPQPSPASAGEEEAPPCRVLIVDDSPLMRRLIRETLSTDPAFTVVGEAADGRAALAAMAQLRPDLTLLDIEMPELDGLGVLRAWALRGPGEVVVVSSAARPGSASAIEARALGAAGIVGKPSGALSPDLRQRGGGAILRTARRAAGLTR